MGGAGAEKPPRATRTEGPPRTLGVLASSVPAPPDETPGGEVDSHGFANQGLAKKKKKM